MSYLQEVLCMLLHYFSESRLARLACRLSLVTLSAFTQWRLLNQLLRNFGQFI